MPNHVAQVLLTSYGKQGCLQRAQKSCFLGWSYKAEVGDPRETPAEPLAEALQNRGIQVGVFDPHLSEESLPDSVEYIGDINDAKGFNLAVLVTAHKVCVELDWSALASNMNTAILYDGRRVLDLEAVGAQGWEVYAVGRPL